VFTLDLDPYIFLLAYVFFQGGCRHAFWVNMVSKVSAAQQVYISVHQAHDNIA
jgi:hypothetical protein